MDKETKLDIFVKVSDMSKVLRKSINHMPKEFRYDIGIDIKKLLREMKYKAFLLQTKDCCEALYFDAQRLKLLVDECIEDEVLLMKGEFTIIEPRRILMNLITLLTSPTEG